MIQEDIVSFFREEILLDRQVERARQQVALQTDFNTYDAFKIFDIRGAGYLDELDFKQGLNEISVYASIEDVKLFFKRYDSNKDGRIRYSEFCSVFVPVDPYHSTLLNRRSSNNIRSHFRDDCFNYGTRILFKELLKAIFETEKSGDYLRHRLLKDPSFTPVDAFKACDVNQDGIITRLEIRDLLLQHNVHATDLDLIALVDKLDRDRDGRISYSEFTDALRPLWFTFNKFNIYIIIQKVLLHPSPPRWAPLHQRSLGPVQTDLLALTFGACRCTSSRSWLSCAWLVGLHRNPRAGACACAQ